MIESKDKKLSFFILLLPALLIYLSIIIFPIGVSTLLSFTKWKNFALVGFIGMKNYISIFTDPEFLQALWHNIQIMLISILGQIPLGIVLAYLLYRKLVRATRFFEMMIFLPITISAVVVALLWNRIFSPVGIFTICMRMITDNPDYVVTIFESPQWAMIPILFVLLWMHTSLYMVMFLANMQRIPQSVIEAAKIDGASESTILTRIVIPALVNVIFTSSIFAISGSLKSFDLVYAMTGGGPVNYTSVMSIYLYKHTFTYNNYGYGSAVSVIIVILSVGLITLSRSLYGRYQKKYE
ncbi:carbohydrate ABC transporter permease [Sediminispirochaeta smaragdinae]|jgi:multiple sugar transport system permease protein/raffinose/stachyose/melibiose transport system permease protein|uniref:Binding-protein-dependent transport systems inner membrane component n=1 Tax=Sediminispirochaeta smaragdinae (strain DSM 11293 / JCM 15392 / SEBR 4228) TaxID=573413 RepID=E1R4A2_SEDSS|nr:sugar ABC transporter permease [Sediminispirochaeta smaragdinae]ADK80524.1 binding-protein-dependent transport systems inner membrane component [Sediminispirochaeta smaragdinae DSM 11293]